jgi:hypothetical protein
MRSKSRKELMSSRNISMVSMKIERQAFQVGGMTQAKALQR